MDRWDFLRVVGAMAAAPSVTVTPADEPRHPPEAVRGDLDAIWSTLLEVGPDPFLTSDRVTVETLMRTTRARMTAPMTVREAWCAIAPVLGALNDGHVALVFPAELNKAAYAFPMEFSLNDEDAVVVSEDDSATVPIGSQLVTVDGVSAAKYRDLTLAAFGAQTRVLHRERMSMSGAWSAVALLGAGPVYHVVWIGADGARREADVPVGRRSATAAAAAPPSAPYTYRTLRDNTVGYLDYRSCEDLPRFTRFVSDMVTTMRRAPVRALVVDIRNNGGGDSDLNDVLWSHVTGTPFKQFGGTTLKACDRLKREYGHGKYVKIYDEQAWNAPNGTLLREDADPNADLVSPAPLAERSTVPIYLLISARTFSSAMSCALAAKDYGLATIVGEETGEPVVSTGELYTFRTPALGLQAYLTTKIFLAPKPHPARRGVVPDIVVPTTLADVAAKRDPVMDRVLAMIAT
jgi:hypothetical protein